MFRGFLFSLLLHGFLIIFMVEILPNLFRPGQFFEVSVDIIALEEIEPEVVPIQQPEAEKPKPQPQEKIPEKKPDNKIRKFKKVTAAQKPDEPAPAAEDDKQKKEVKGKKSGSKKDSDDGLDEILQEQYDAAAQERKINSLLSEIKSLQNIQKEKAARDRATSGKGLSTAEIGSIRSQVNGCWYNYFGKVFADEDLSNIKVQVYVSLDENGNVIDARPLENVESYMNLDNTLYRKVVDSAVYSFLRCRQIENLPKEKYEYWKEFEFTFDPTFNGQ